MEKMLFCFDMPEGNAYFGGIACIINKYLEHAADFLGNGYEIGLHNYEAAKSGGGIGRKLGNIILMLNQGRSLKNRILQDRAVNIHIHSSRKWTLLRDLLIVRHVRKHLGGLVFLSIHYADIDGILYSNRLLRRFCINTINKRVDRVIFLAHKTMDEFIAAGMNPARAEILHTFHDLREAGPGRANDGRLHLLFMGSIDRRKGILDLLEVLESMDKNGYTLDICGKVTDPSLAEIFENYMKKLEPAITMHGYVTGREKNDILAKSDVLVLPSYGEGMPIVILEAMAAGCAVIATTVGGIPELITEGVNGRLFEPGDKEALKALIVHMQETPSELEKMKEYNREAGKMYSLDENIKLLSQIYSRAGAGNV